MVTKSRRQERKMPPDQPVIDTTPYGYGKDDSVTDLTEKSAITNHVLVTKGKSIRYTAMAGHLVTTDPYSAQPAAKIFYVAFTAKDAPSSRPVTFFTMAVLARRRCSYCSDRLDHDESKPACRISLHLLHTRWSIIKRVCWTTPIWSSSTPWGPATRQQPRRARTESSGEWMKTRAPSNSSSSAI
jgi:hypothetical protein